MANRKLIWWARLTLRKSCAHCGELYATTAADEACDGPACRFCATWIAAGSPEDFDFTDWDAALDQLPYLLRQRPSVRLLNCSTASYYASTTDEDREVAECQLRDEYAAATWPVRLAYNAGQLIGRAWREVHFHAGIAFDWARNPDKEHTP